MEESQHTTSSFDLSVICESIMGFLAYFCAVVLLFKKEFYYVIHRTSSSLLYAIQCIGCIVLVIYVYHNTCHLYQFGA